MSTVQSASNFPIFLGDTISLSALAVVDTSGTLVTSPTSITLLIVRPDQSIASTVNASQIANDGSGNFHYYYTIPSTDMQGIWQAKWTFVNGSYTTEVAMTFAVNQFNGALIPPTSSQTAGLVVSINTQVFQVLSQDPSNPSLGQAWFSSPNAVAKYWNGITNISLTQILPSYGTDPLTPFAGQSWWNSASLLAKYYNGYQNISITPLAPMNRVRVTPNGPQDGGDYGSKTPGTATNGIVEAVNYLNGLGGGTVEIGVGSFSGLPNIALANIQNVVLAGEGDGTLLTLANNANSDFFDLTNCTNVWFMNMMVDGNRANNGSTPANEGMGIFFEDCNNSGVIGSKVRNTIGRALGTQSISAGNFDITFRDNYVTNCGGITGAVNEGTLFITGVTRPKVVNNFLVSNFNEGIAVGHGMGQPAYDALIAGNFIYNQGTAAGGVVLRTCYEVLVIGNKIYNNSATSTPSYAAGICLGPNAQDRSKYNYGMSQGVQCIGNQIYNFNNDGITVNADASLVSGNVCIGNSRRGIHVQGAKGCTVTSNVCADNGNYGLRVDPDTSSPPTVYPVGNLVANNWCANYQTTTQGTGIFEAGPTGTDLNYFYDNYCPISTSYPYYNSTGSLVLFGPNSVARGNIGYNPIGLQTAPGVVNSPVPNNFGSPIDVYVSVGTTATTISKNGTSLGSFVSTTLPVHLEVSETIQLSQTNGVSWKWFGS